MAKTRKTGKRDKQAAAAGAAAILTAASLLVGGLFRSPGDLMRRDADLPGPAYTDTLLDDDGDDGDDADGQDTEEKQRKRSGLRALLRERILRLPLAVRALVVLPLWLAGSGLMALGSALWAGASPWVQGLLGFLLWAGVLLGGFLLAGKALFPDLPLKKLLDRRRLPVLVLAALALAAADRVLAFAWPEYGGFRAALVSCGALAVFSAAVFSFSRRERRRRAALPPPAEEPVPAKPDKLHFTDPGGDFTISLH